jgi:hypothetical protein
MGYRYLQNGFAVEEFPNFSWAQINSFSQMLKKGVQ